MVAQVGQGEWLWDWGPRAFVYFLHVFLSGLSFFFFLGDGRKELFLGSFPFLKKEAN